MNHFQKESIPLQESIPHVELITLLESIHLQFCSVR